MKPITIFEKYRDNLNFLIENNLIDKKFHSFKNHYICPICLNPYNKIDEQTPLTLEDAPQKSVGGKKNTLTCKKCNNEAGTKIDHHLIHRLNELDNSKFLPNTEFPIKTNIDGRNFNATLKIDEHGRMRVFHSKKNNNPSLLDKHIPEMKKGKAIDFSFVKKNIIPDNLDYAVLKSAYIILFQYTGYKIILNQEFDIIRKQILNPESRIIPKNFYFFSHEPFMNDGVHFVCEKGMEIILVIFTAKTGKSSRNFCVFLPIPNKDYSNTLENIFEIKQEKGEIVLTAFPENIDAVNYLGDLERIQRLDNWFNTY